MSSTEYLDFDILLESVGDEYSARVLYSPAGQARINFKLPFSQLELENFILKVSRTHNKVRGVRANEVDTARTFGGLLYKTIFRDTIQGCLQTSLDEASQRGTGLRLRLRLGSPELANLPWEFLFNPDLNRFMALSVSTPIVRYLELPERIRPLNVTPPLRILVMISSPMDYPPLDVEQEWTNIVSAVSDLEKSGQVEIERLQTASLNGLYRQLSKKQYHIFHFIGHGSFLEETQDGVLIFEGDDQVGKTIDGQELGTILFDHGSLRLAVINACEGARTGAADPFTGVAQSLLQQRIPAVIAMQFEVSDQTSIVFAHQFYHSVVSGMPVDAALSQSRKAIFAGSSGDSIEWGTPVLYMRSPDGRIFDLAEQTINRTDTNEENLPYASLQARKGILAGQIIQIKKKVTLIGRDEQATLSISDTGISRRHAQITWSHDGYILQDLNSTNGTMVNGARIDRPLRLQNNDVIQMGASVLVFQWTGETKPAVFKENPILSTTPLIDTGPVIPGKPETPREEEKLARPNVRAEAQDLLVGLGGKLKERWQQQRRAPEPSPAPARPITGGPEAAPGEEERGPRIEQQSQPEPSPAVLQAKAIEEPGPKPAPAAPQPSPEARIPTVPEKEELPEDPFLLLALARAAQDAGQLERAIQHFEAILKHDPEHVEAKAELLAARKARESSRKQEEPKIEMQYNQGLYHYEAGRRSIALTYFRRVRATAGNYRDVDFLIAMIEAELSQKPNNSLANLMSQWNTQRSEEMARYYELPVLDLGLLAEDLRQHFEVNGYENQIIKQEQSIYIQGKKGGWRSWLGLGQAITIILQPFEGGLRASVGGGKWLEQGAAVAAGFFLLTPLLITGGAGLFQQITLVEALWKIIETFVTIRGGNRAK